MSNQAPTSSSDLGSSSNELNSKPAAQSLLESVLSEEGSTSTSAKRKRKRKDSIPQSNTPAAEHYKSRVDGKRVQLHNPDRPRPKNDPNDVKEIKRRGRDKRVKRNEKDAFKKKPSSSISTKSKGKQNVDYSELKALSKLDSTKYGRGKRKLTYDSTAEEREEGRRAGAKLPLSRKEKVSRGLMGMDKDLSPQTLHPLHLLWTSYMHQLLGLVDIDGKISTAALSSSQGSWTISHHHLNSMQVSVSKADLCGALIRVTRSNNPALVHLSGVIASESTNTLVLIPLKDHDFFPSESLDSGSKSSTTHNVKPRVIPKQNSVFALSIPLPKCPSSTGDEKQCLEFSLHGNQMMHSLPARTSRKYKMRKTIEI